MYEAGFELVPLIRHVSEYDSFKTERIGKIDLFSAPAGHFLNT
jgi:hypothetical protein